MSHLIGAEHQAKGNQTSHPYSQCDKRGCNQAAPWYAPLTRQERHDCYMALGKGHIAAEKLNRYLWRERKESTSVDMMASELFEISTEIFAAC